MGIDYTEAYTSFHEENPKFMAGYSVCHYAPMIATLVEENHAQTLLDYGSGKGYQYLARRIHDVWGGILPHCYDPGVRQLSEKPIGQFDGIICTDVLEHIAEDDLDDVLLEIKGYSARRPKHNSFIFLVIACRPAKKHFADGTNVHLTIKPPTWWNDRLKILRQSGLLIRVEYDEKR